MCGNVLIASRPHWGSTSGERPGATEGWIQAVDNVRLRALAAGDAQGNGNVNPFDILALITAQKFNVTGGDTTWAEGDFNQDGVFNPFDLLAMISSLDGEFPKTFAADASASGQAGGDISAVPEPGSFSLCVFGILGLLVYHWRKR